MIRSEETRAGESSVRWCGRAGLSQLTEAGGGWSAASDLCGPQTWCPGEAAYLCWWRQRARHGDQREWEKSIVRPQSLQSWPRPRPLRQPSLPLLAHFYQACLGLTHSLSRLSTEQSLQPTHQQFVLKLSSSYFSRPLQPASIDPSQTLRWINMKFVI